MLGTGLSSVSHRVGCAQGCPLSSDAQVKRPVLWVGPPVTCISASTQRLSCHLFFHDTLASVDTLLLLHDPKAPLTKGCCMQQLINEGFGGHREPWGSCLPQQPENNLKDDLRDSSPRFLATLLSVPFSLAALLPGPPTTVGCYADGRLTVYPREN